MCAASFPEKQMGTYFLEMTLQSPPRDLLIALKKRKLPGMLLMEERIGRVSSFIIFFILFIKKYKKGLHLFIRSSMI